MTMIQNFSIPADDDVAIDFDVTGNLNGDTLTGYTVIWRVLEQAYGVPTTDLVLQKTSESGGGIDILESPPNHFTLNILAEDTIGLLCNYYHEAVIVDGGGARSTIVCGIMTVTYTISSVADRLELEDEDFLILD